MSIKEAIACVNEAIGCVHDIGDEPLHEVIPSCDQATMELQAVLGMLDPLIEHKPLTFDQWIRLIVNEQFNVELVNEGMDAELSFNDFVDVLIRHFSIPSDS